MRPNTEPHRKAMIFDRRPREFWSVEAVGANVNELRPETMSSQQSDAGQSTMILSAPTTYHLNGLLQRASICYTGI